MKSGDRRLVILPVVLILTAAMFASNFGSGVTGMLYSEDEGFIGSPVYATLEESCSCGPIPAPTNECWDWVTLPTHDGGDSNYADKRSRVKGTWYATNMNPCKNTAESCEGEPPCTIEWQCIVNGKVSSEISTLRGSALCITSV
jgi:hypothetical protein